VGEQRTEIRLGCQPEVRVQRAGAPRPQPDLGRGLLAGDDQRPGTGGGAARGDLQQQGGLAHPGFAGE
jgi:hypothetical protein